MKNLHWFVYIEDINRDKITKYDIFNCVAFSNDIKKEYKEYKDNFELFSERVNRNLRYYFWSKAEWEIILSDWPPSDSFKEEKIDVYDQVMLNWNVFIKYVWDNIK